MVGILAAVQGSVRFLLYWFERLPVDPSAYCFTGYAAMPLYMLVASKPPVWERLVSGLTASG